MGVILISPQSFGLLIHIPSYDRVMREENLRKNQVVRYNLCSKMPLMSNQKVEEALSLICTLKLLQKESAILNYLRLIILGNLPIPIVGHPSFRAVSRFDVRFNRRTIVEIIFR